MRVDRNVRLRLQGAVAEIARHQQVAAERRRRVAIGHQNARPCRLQQRSVTAAWQAGQILTVECIPARTVEEYPIVHALGDQPRRAGKNILDRVHRVHNVGRVLADLAPLRQCGHRHLRGRRQRHGQQRNHQDQNRAPQDQPEASAGPFDSVQSNHGT